MKAFVIHAERLKERAEHIDRMLSEEGIEYEFVNEGNDDEKIQGYLDKYMKDGRELLHRKVPRSLCTISHFLAYERILAGNMDGALVLEDDIENNDDYVLCKTDDDVRNATKDFIGKGIATFTVIYKISDFERNGVKGEETVGYIQNIAIYAQNQYNCVKTEYMEWKFDGYMQMTMTFMNAPTR